MSKYEFITNNLSNQKINDILVDGETIIWQAKQKETKYYTKKVTLFL